MMVVVLMGTDPVSNSDGSGVDGDRSSEYQ